MDSDAEYESCHNCNFLLPKSVSDMLPDGAPGSPAKNGRGQNGSPIMRTTQPIVAYGSPEDSDDEEDSPTGSFVPHTTHLEISPTASHASALGGSSASSPLYAPKTHIHNLTYITRRHPESQSVYSRLRHSCLRTLASEQLPKSAHTGALVFGDSIAGHTIAYIFKLPDYRSRGKRKTYALTALGRDSWRVMGAMVQVTKAFEAIAGQIVSMADRVFERESAISARPSISDLLRSPPLSSSLPVAPVTPTPGSPQADRAKSSTNSPVSSQRALPTESSFLAAKMGPNGYPRVSRELMRAKGLSEIVGNDNFYLELHAQFCVILANLVKELSR
jgi:hypothetical protein